MRPRKRIAASRPRSLPALGANQVWAYDFVYDACANGQQLKCLTVIDEYTRECLAIDVAGSIRSSRVIELLSKLVSTHGAPSYLRFRQRSGIRFQGNPALADASKHRCGAHRPGQTVAEWLE